MTEPSRLIIFKNDLKTDELEEFFQTSKVPATTVWLIFPIDSIKHFKALMDVKLFFSSVPSVNDEQLD